MALVECSGCDSTFDLNGWDDYGGVPLCASCRLAEDAGEALRLLECGRDEEALAEIRDHVDHPPAVKRDLVIENLVYEAGEYLRLGDRDEAMHRLRLAAHPKFFSLDDCRNQYAASMGERA